MSSSRAPVKPSLRRRRSLPRPQAPEGVVTIVATGDIVMGSTPDLPPDGGPLVLRRRPDRPRGRRRAREPRGDALRRRQLEVRQRRSTNCFAFQTPPVLRALAGAGRIHRAQPREQPRVRLRRERAAADDRSAQGPSACGTPGGPGEVTFSRSARSGSPSSASRRTRGRGRSTTSRRRRRLVRKAARRADVVVVDDARGRRGLASAQHVPRRNEFFLGENRGNVRRGSRTPSSTPAPTSSSATGRTCCAGWSGTRAG